VGNLAVYYLLMEIQKGGKEMELLGLLEVVKLEISHCQLPQNENTDTEVVETTLDLSNFDVGDIIEFVPSIDGLPLRFVITEKNGGGLKLHLLTKYVEFATPADLVVRYKYQFHFNGKNYTVENTELVIPQLWVEIPERVKVKAPFPMDVVKLGHIDPKPIREREKVQVKRKGAWREFFRLMSARLLNFFNLTVGD
jgi:hypothetical protein